MSGLLTSLINTSRSLNAHARSIEIAGKNLANINNPNYAKQSASVNDLGVVRTQSGDQFLGLEVGRVIDARDSVLDRQILRETMTTNALEGQKGFNEIIEVSLGEVIDRSSSTATIGSADEVASSSGILQAMDQFFTALNEVSANPTNSSVKSVFLEKADILTDRFRSLDARLSKTDEDITFAINKDVKTVNTLLEKIATLNKDINQFELGQASLALDLRSQRQATLEELAQYIDFEVTDPPVGGLGGDIKVRVTKEDGSKINLVSGSFVSNDMSFASNIFSAGSPAQPLALKGGKLSGYLNARLEILSPLKASIDNMAKQLITSVNAVYPNDFFDADPTYFNASGIRMDASLNANSLTVGTAGAGSNDIAMAMIALQNRSFSTPTDYIDGSLRSHYVDEVISKAQDFNSVDQKLESQTLVENMLKSRRSSATGVSVDEEVTDLMRFQRAFQASSRVISILDDLLNQIVTGF